MVVVAIQEGAQGTATMIVARPDLRIGPLPGQGAVVALREALEDTLLWHPDIGELHLLLGECHWRLASNHRLHGYRFRSELWLAEDHLVKAMDLLHSGERVHPHHRPEHDQPHMTGRDEPDMMNGARAHYWLGQVHMTIGDYVQAINHLSIAESLIGNQHDLARAHVRLVRAQAFFRNGWYTRCGEVCESVIATCEADLAPIRNDRVKWVNRLNANIGPARDPIYLGSVLATAYCRLAFSNAHRDEMRKNALSHLEKALAFAKLLEDPDTRSSCEGECCHAKGWIYFQLGQPDDALKWLGKATSRPDSEFYLHLALVCERKASEVSDGVTRWEWVAQAREHLDKVRMLAIDRAHVERAKGVSSRLPEAKAFKVPSGAPDRTVRVPTPEEVSKPRL